MYGFKWRLIWPSKCHVPPVCLSRSSQLNVNFASKDLLRQLSLCKIIMNRLSRGMKRGLIATDWHDKLKEKKIRNVKWNFFFHSWVLGEFLCKMYQFVHSLSYTASIFILVVICMERYFAIIHPITCKQILTSTRLRVSEKCHVVKRLSFLYNKITTVFEKNLSNSTQNSYYRHRLFKPVPIVR